MTGLHDMWSKMQVFLPFPKSSLANILFQQHVQKHFFVSTQRQHWPSELSQRATKREWSGETVFKLESSIVDAILNGTLWPCSLSALCAPLLNLPLCTAFPMLWASFAESSPYKASRGSSRFPLLNGWPLQSILWHQQQKLNWETFLQCEHNAMERRKYGGSDKLPVLWDGRVRHTLGGHQMSQHPHCSCQGVSKGAQNAVLVWSRYPRVHSISTTHTFLT